MFLHIYKTGGSTLSYVLHPFSRLSEKLLSSRFYPIASTTLRSLDTLHFVRKLPFMRHQMSLHKHARYEDIASLLGASRDQYKIFALIRDPYDWIASLHAYIAQTPSHQGFTFALESSLPKYIEWFINSKQPLQSDLISEGSGLYGVDRIYSMERVLQDPSDLYRWLGIEKSLSLSACVPHHNKSRRDPTSSLPQWLLEEYADYVLPDLTLSALASVTGWFPVRGFRDSQLRRFAASLLPAI